MRFYNNVLPNCDYSAAITTGRAQKSRAAMISRRSRLSPLILLCFSSLQRTYQRSYLPNKGSAEMTAETKTNTRRNVLKGGAALAEAEAALLS
jgi:hypothetical protein